MTFVVSSEQLRALIDALEEGDEITPDMRRWLIAALYDLGLYNAIEEKKRQRGHPVAAETWLAARVAQRLMDDYGVPTSKEAVWAAAPHVDQKQHNAITRALQKLRKGKSPMYFGLVHPHLVDQAADNINPARLEQYFIRKTRNK